MFLSVMFLQFFISKVLLEKQLLTNMFPNLTNGIALYEDACRKEAQVFKVQ